MAPEPTVWKDFEIEVPAGCKVIPVPARDMVVVYPSDRDPSADAADPAFSVSISCLHDGAALSLDEHARNMMRTRVIPGPPEQWDAVVAGVAALSFVWVDGVAKITSWFLDVEGKRYEVQFTTPLWPSAPGQEVAHALRELVKDLRLKKTSHFPD